MVAGCRSAVTATEVSPPQKAIGNRLFAGFYYCIVSSSVWSVRNVKSPLSNCWLLL